MNLQLKRRHAKKKKKKNVDDEPDGDPMMGETPVKEPKKVVEAEKYTVAKTFTNACVSGAIHQSK